MFVLTPAIRDFVLVLDPVALDALATQNSGGVIRLIHALRLLPTPITVSLVLPTYLANPAQISSARRIGQVAPLTDESDVPPLKLSRQMLGRYRGRIERGAEDGGRGLRLLALGHHLKADGVVTAIPSLVEAKYPLSHHHAVRIIRPKDVADFVEVCARGHLTFCRAMPRPTFLPPDIFYSFADPKARRLWEWFNKMVPRLSDKTLAEMLRSALLNRYAFILYARDMVRFADLQKQHYSRRGRRGQFRFVLNYHLTTFYVQIWGMLDALAGIANRKLALGLDSRKCYLNRDDFVDALAAQKPALVQFIKTYRTKWVNVIGDVRHPVAHSALLLQTDLVVDTEESKKGDAEVAEIIRAEERGFLDVIPPEFSRTMEALLIDQWRDKKRKIQSDDVIYAENPTGGGYFRGPVVSLDFDLEMLNAFVDAFLFACFG